MTICEALAKQLNHIRNRRGMTVTEFSDLLDISRSSLQAILSGKANPRSDTIDHIAFHLQIDPVILLVSPIEIRDLSQFTELVAAQLTEIMQAMIGEYYERDHL